MTERAEEWICIKFCIKLEHSLEETTQMIQKDTAMSNWWLAASSNNASANGSLLVQFFGKTSNHPGDSAPLQPRFGVLRHLIFPKTKITFEREEISDHLWDSGKYDGAADGDWENCVWSQGAYFEGEWQCHCPMSMFLISCIFFNKCLFSTVCGWIPSGQISLHTYIWRQTGYL